jgi:hypothetical protein
MNAGAITVTIDADYSKLKGAVAAAKKTAEDGGKEMGKAGAAGFGDTFRRGVMEQLKGVGLAIIGVQAAQGFLKAMASTIRGDKTVAEAYVDFVKALPVVGALAEVVEAGFDRFTLPRQQIEKSASEREVDEMRRRAALARADEEIAAQKALEDSVRRAATIEQETRQAGLVADLKSSMSADVKLEKAKQLLALEEEITRAARDAAEAAAVSEQEKSAIRGSFEERLRAVQDEFVARKKAIEKEESDRLKAQADLAAKQKADAEELEILRIQATNEEFRYQMERQAELKRAEEESLATRIEAQRAGVGSVSTFAGEFKFDAYSDAAKKKNDDTMVKELKTIREKISLGGFA